MDRGADPGAGDPVVSEYQYYEFRAVDRPLTSPQMTELRALSTRAHITATSFVNVYNYGDFRGDPAKLMATMFDAFVYVANWGTHELMLRLPRRLLDSKAVAEFRTENSLRAWVKGEHIVLCFRAEELEGDLEEGEGWMDSLLPVRADFLRGDLRALYLGWLRGVQNEDVDDAEAAPPPPGLLSLPPHLESLVEFLDIDTDLVEAAAETSAELDETAVSREELSRWVAGLPDAKKNALLLEMAGGGSPHAGEELLRRFRQCRPEPSAEPASTGQAPRTAGELRLAAQRRAEERRLREAERRGQEKERKEREKAAARNQYLEGLAKKEPQTWSRVEALIAMKRPQDYDRAVELLKDLQELAERNLRSKEYEWQLHCLRERHVKKPSLLERLRAAGLR